MFLDESGAKTNMTRLYGRAGRSERVRDSAPSAGWSTTTMLSAMSVRGPQAPWVFDGPVDGELFRVYAEQVLAPTLRHGDILVMDNLSTHKDRYARAAIEATGAIIWDLPPYSPDLNPIEKMWSKLKAYIRKIKPRGEEELVKAIGQALELVTSSDIAGWFASCGYNLL